MIKEFVDQLKPDQYKDLMQALVQHAAKTNSFGELVHYIIPSIGVIMSETDKREEGLVLVSDAIRATWDRALASCQFATKYY